MKSATSSIGPGMGKTANAASPLSGFGIRPSLTRIFTARIRRRAAATFLYGPSELHPEEDGKYPEDETAERVERRRGQRSVL